MLTWAYRYLAVAVVSGLGFAVLKDAEPWQPEQVPAGRERQAAVEPEDADLAPLEMVIPAGPHGHFVIEAVVNGTPLDFVVDTGASDVMLSPDDAERLGFRDTELRFTRRYQTANGEVAAAPVRLRELRIGQFRVYDLPASVNAAPLRVSLLGMTFLRELRGYEVENDRLILRW